MAGLRMKSSYGVIAGTFALSAVTIASADQSGSEATTSGASELTEIVVTAQRKSENAERTPVSVTAISQEGLREKAIVSEQDLQAASPGLTVRSTTNANQLNFAIRGQSVDTFSNSPSAVLQYFDEVQVSPYSATPFYDLQSVQVVKGPQGTLFGRNGTGGAVLFTSAEPTNKFEGYFTLRAGNYASKSFEGAINIPLIDDKLLFRLASTYQYHEGYAYNLYDDSRVGKVERGGIRPSLFIRFSDSLTDTLVMNYSSSGGNNQPNVAYSAYAPGSTHNGYTLTSTGSLLFSPALDSVVGVPGAWAAYLAAHPKAYSGGLDAYTALQNARGPYVVDLDSDLTHHAHDITVSNVTKLDLTPDLTLKNIIGYSYSYAFDTQEYDGSPYNIEGEGEPGANPIGGYYAIRSTSEEIQLQGKAFDSHLQFTTGFYYSNDKLDQNNAVYVFDVTPIIPVTLELLPAREYNKTYAGYIQGTYDLKDLTGVGGLSVTAGGRYTKVDFGQIAQPGSPHYGEEGYPAVLAGSIDKPSWQFGVQEQLNPATLLYIVSRNSFRSGGFNPQSPARPGTAAAGGAQFSPESTTDVEIGSKFQGHIANIPLRLNIDFYQQWVKNVQRTTYATIPDFGLSALTVNIPEARIRGAELDLETRPLNWLSVGGNAAFTDGKFTNNAVSVFGELQLFGPISDTPKWSGTAFVQVDIPALQQIGRISVRGDVYAQSMFTFSSQSATISPYTNIPMYALTNFRLALDNIGGSQVSVAASVRNAFDRVYYTGGVPTGVITSINTATPGAPRTFFGEVHYKF